MFFSFAAAQTSLNLSRLSSIEQLMFFLHGGENRCQTHSNLATDIYLLKLSDAAPKMATSLAPASTYSMNSVVEENMMGKALSRNLLTNNISEKEWNGTWSRQMTFLLGYCQPLYCMMIEIRENQSTQNYIFSRQ